MRLTQFYASAIIVLQVPVAFAQMKDIIPVNIPAGVKAAYPTWSVATPAWVFRCFRDTKGSGREAYFGQVYDRESKLMTASAKMIGVPEGMRWSGKSGQEEGTS